MAALAELVVFHSRPVAPTRRVALGACSLPVDPPPGFGGLLLAAVVARFAPDVDAELMGELHTLMRQLERGQRISQPRLRHRFQGDTIGLTKSTHRVVGVGDTVAFELSASGTPEQQVLGALYAAGRFAPGVRAPIFDALRRALRFTGPLGPSFVASVMGRSRSAEWSTHSIADPLVWARRVLGIAATAEVKRADVQQRFRAELRAAHPDSGGDEDLAARRIAELTEARRILLAQHA